MKASDTDIFFIPGLGGAGPEHWQSRWQARLSTGHRVELPKADKPERDAWVGVVADAVNLSQRPVVLVGQGLGIATIVNALPKLVADVRGAFLVAPPDLDRAGLKPRGIKAFGPYPRDPLPFPSILVGSRNDPSCDIAVAEDIAAAWGSLFVDAGEAGSIDAEAGYGPWPEGSLTFAKLLSRL